MESTYADTYSQQELDNAMGKKEKISDVDLAKLQEAARNSGKSLDELMKLISKPLVPTDDELVDRWKSTAVCTHGTWREYHNGFWPKIDESQVRSELLNICRAAKHEKIRPTSGKVNSMLSLAQDMRRLPLESLDRNPHLIVLKNGTLDLRSMALRKHAMRDYATVGLPYDYDPDAKATTFCRVLTETVPNEASFIQEFAGYCLTPDTQHETALWFYGPPGCGKSTILGGIQAMLGGFCGHLGLADVERSSFALSSLPGLRLVMATEQPKGYARATNILNALISGEELTVEEKFKPSYSIKPVAKIAWAMNSLPVLNDASNGLFRRVKIVKFSALKTERDPKLKDQIAKEVSGIFNWALEGLARLKARGHFEIPESIAAAVAEYQLDNDKTGMFLEERCEISEKSEVSAQELFEAYSNWCFAAGFKPVANTRFKEDLVGMGFEQKRKTAGKYWAGIKLLLTAH